jgi:hypothetical protein
VVEPLIPSQISANNARVHGSLLTGGTGGQVIGVGKKALGQTYADMFQAKGAKRAMVVHSQGPFPSQEATFKYFDRLLSSILTTFT